MTIDTLKETESVQEKILSGKTIVDFPAGPTGTNATVTHNLGYIPAVKFYYETNQNNNMIPEPATVYGAGVADSINSAFGDVEVLLSIFTDILFFTIARNPGVSSRTITIHYLLYSDRLN